MGGIPDGFAPVGSGTGRAAAAGGLEEYEGQEFEEIDFGDFDWDDAYDDVGDEDSDTYGEDAR